MRVQIQLRIITDDDSVISADEILHLDKGDDRVEAIGLSFGEAKTVLADIQERVVTAQAASFLARRRCCDRCGCSLLSKGPGRIQFRTAFGIIPLVSPRFHRCRCQPVATKTFSPLTELLTEHTAPELVYLETKWASLVSYGMTTDLLKEVLPIGSLANPSTIRRHLHRVAARYEAELDDERLGGIAGGPTDAQPQPMPQEAIIVGLDGGYLRNWHDKKRNFEVIVGKSLAPGREDRYFGLVRSQDDQLDRRLGAVLQTQGLPGSQAVTMLTDGGDSVRALTGELSPGAVPILDWFHVAMRLTGLGQYVKGLAHHNPVEATALQDRLERIKWRLWHGDADEALIRAEQMATDVAALDSGYPKLKRLVKATADLATYIGDNAAALPDYSERWLNGERISTAFVESTVNIVVSRRFAKKQQMQWSKAGAHLLLQTRTQALDGTLHDLFARSYPAMAANDTQVPALATAA
jgi:hypothetical protein